MMDTIAIEAALRAGFGETAKVRARRPGTIYQIEIPAYLADGDAAAIFVRPGSNGLVVMTDLGHTSMRISYSRKLTPAVDEALDRLARRHGFRHAEGTLASEMPASEIFAGAMGLLQIEAEAEASIATSFARGESAESFRLTVRDAIGAAFGSACTFDFHAEDDPQGLYSVDAIIRGFRTTLGVAITATDLDAERAVSVKLRLDPMLPEPHRWVALPRNINELREKTRLRLMKEHLVPIPRFDDERADFAKKLAALAA